MEERRLVNNANDHELRAVRGEDRIPVGNALGGCVGCPGSSLWKATPLSASERQYVVIISALLLLNYLTFGKFL